MGKVWKGPDLTQFETDPRVQEIEEKLAAQFLETLDRLDPRAVYAIPAGIVFVYLLFCLLCRCICVKTSNPPSPLIWLPFLKQIDYERLTALARRWHIAPGVVVDPAVCFGKPVVEEVGIPTAVLAAAYHANDRDADAVAAWYDVSPEHVRAASAFEAGRAA